MKINKTSKFPALYRRHNVVIKKAGQFNTTRPRYDLYAFILDQIKDYIPH